MYIGIDSDGLLYERYSFSVVGIWPTPTLIPANLVAGSPKIILATSKSTHEKDFLLFREDSYDPQSRIKRGRFYVSQGDYTVWQATTHPARKDNVVRGPDISVHTYRSFSVQEQISLRPALGMSVVLGKGKSATICSLISIETNHYSEELVALRMRQTYGILPNLHVEKIPLVGRDNVINAIGKISEEIHRAGPESIVTRCREAAEAILSTFLQDKAISPAGQDLNRLTSDFKKYNERLPQGEQKRNVYHASEIIRNFHFRDRNNAKERLEIIPLKEQDSDLAVQCVGTILRDLGWADWEVV